MAQEKTHAMWKVDAVRLNDQDVMIRFVVSLDSGWHMYSSINPIEDLRLRFSFEKSDAYEFNGILKEETVALERYDNVFGQRLRTFERYATFSQRISLNAGHHLVKGSIRFVINSGNDLPKAQGLSFSVGVSTANKSLSKSTAAN